jgi:hypothetical protein
MDRLAFYTSCTDSEDPELMCADALVLTRAMDALDAVADARTGATVRVSAVEGLRARLPHMRRVI